MTQEFFSIWTSPQKSVTQFIPLGMCDVCAGDNAVYNFRFGRIVESVKYAGNDALLCR